MEPVSYAPVEEDCTSGLVIEVSIDSDEVGADVILLHGCPQSCMPNHTYVFKMPCLVDPTGSPSRGGDVTV